MGVVSKTVCACAIAVRYIVAKTENCIYIALVLNAPVLKIFSPELGVFVSGKFFKAEMNVKDIGKSIGTRGID
ncbi:hypothetical protein CULCOIPH002_00200 [Corynebacterium ulcerans]|uniref:Uncharacterized protein n=1 Tax=Corynebacterium ulcerans TaxID=65058 RepID=A0ABD0BFQ9_CORUL|nr:hypothetical protein CULC0102_0761 [Corynebacterium ulcerans 0102]BBJ71619.1 hypothetical protein CULC0211_07530 [Corynebacterium ulcerans]BBJ73924.1 hypothetical protein CULCFH20161_07510 [Corynebacterium ulcerans]GJJ34154.1 hypothetical protein CULCOIPH001_13620 [Corynebacterium ulcerans]GJJ35108.1 hypothetical protein CULCOIPH002_00200 [Corynebacterium ulcerans]